MMGAIMLPETLLGFYPFEVCWCDTVAAVDASAAAEVDWCCREQSEQQQQQQ
jgi:hypothetical protein